MFSDLSVNRLDWCRILFWTRIWKNFENRSKYKARLAILVTEGWEFSKIGKITDFWPFLYNSLHIKWCFKYLDGLFLFVSLQYAPTKLIIAKLSSFLVFLLDFSRPPLEDLVNGHILFIFCSHMTLIPQMKGLNEANSTRYVKKALDKNTSVY